MKAELGVAVSNRYGAGVIFSSETEQEAHLLNSLAFAGAPRIVAYERLSTGQIRLTIAPTEVKDGK